MAALDPKAQTIPTGAPATATASKPFPPDVPNPAMNGNGNGNGHQAEMNANILPSTPLNKPNGTLPNTPLAISIISVGLASLVILPLTLVGAPYLQSISADWARPRLAVYLASVGVFHILEFWVTAGYNPAKLSVDSFLINNGAGYHAAHIGGLVEYFVTSYFFPKRYEGLVSTLPYLFPVFALLAIAQTVRSLAMIHAATSFSHVVKAIKHDDHVLITKGVYAWVRHPSYVGFFWWAIATQLLLGNVASTLAFVYVLGKFFYYRIIGEERHLVRFFGNDYIEYRKRVGTGLPFPIPIK